MDRKFTKILVFLSAIFMTTAVFAFQVQINATDITCHGANDGTASAYIVDGDGGNYTFAWSTGSTSQSINALSAGNYHVTATDQSGIQATRTVYITDPAAISLSMNASYETCDISHDGTAAVSATGGTQPYSVKWSDPAGQTFWVAYNLSAGDYSVTITDANGCQAVGTVTVEPSPEGIWLGTSTTDASCMNDCNGTATVMPMTGKAPYTYHWSNGQTTDKATGLCAGDYSVTVSDANGCQSVDNATIVSGPAIVATVSSSPSGCGGSNSGSASVSASGGDGNFSYSWSNGGSSSTIMDLAAGTYTVTVTDGNGCTVVKSVEVESSAASNIGYTLSSNDVTCFGNCDGSAEANITSGTAPFSYNWSTGSTSSAISGLCAGTYTVTVSDADGCPVVKMINVGSPTEISLAASATNANCGANDGTASASATAGNGGFSYTWSNGAMGDNINGLTAGTYMVTATDINGCTAVTTVTVATTGSSMTATTTSSPTSCSDSNDGAASVQVSGGTSPYNYEWSNGATGANANGLSGGTHTVTITDGSGCTLVESVSVSTPSEISIFISSNPATCGSSNGSATVNVTGGAGAYTYLWSNNATTSSITDVPAGNYTLAVADGNLCLANAVVIIGQSGSNVEASATGTDVSCNGGNDGSATITVTTGTAPYVYSWADGSTMGTNSNLSAGDHGWMVTDASGCVATGTVTIGEPSAMVLTTMVVDASCGGDNGMASVDVTGGTAPYTYHWNDTFGQTMANAMTLPAGTYIVLVTDANGCTANATVTVNSTEGFTCAVSIASSYGGAHISSIGGSDGSAAVSMNGGSGTFSFAWSNGATNQQVTGLSAGTYTVLVTDDVTGCTCESTVTLEDPAKLGNFVWLDANMNGLQDAGEAGMEGVVVNVTGTSAYGMAIDLTMTTDATGMYMFTLPPGAYKVTFTAPENHDFTTANAGDDTLDSDADANTGMTQVVTLASGDYNPSLDAGLVKTCVSVGNYVWFDDGQDGLQNTGEAGVPNFVVNLLNAADNSVVASTTTGADGSYLFDCVLPGTYVIQFDPASLPDGYQFTTQDVNNGNADANDSDANATGLTDPFTVSITGGDDLKFDAGIHTNCDNVHFPGTVGYDQMLCPGDTPAEFVTITEAIGGTGEFEYIWMEKVIEAGSQWEPIPGSTNPTYQSPPLMTTTLFRKCVRRAGCVTYLEPPAITIIVNDTCGNGFVSLTGTVLAAEVSLEWVTGTENGDFSYLVEHSANGVDFVSMDLLDGQGISNANNYYSYMDKHPHVGTNYYRVVMNGPNGFEMTSDVIKVILKQDGQELGVFPNPANDIFYVDIMTEKVDYGSVELMDANGKVLKTYPVKAGQSGPRPFLIPDLSAGLYFVKVTVNGEVKMMKLRKQ